MHLSCFTLQTEEIRGTPDTTFERAATHLPQQAGAMFKGTSRDASGWPADPHVARSEAEETRQVTADPKPQARTRQRVILTASA